MDVVLCPARLMFTNIPYVLAVVAAAAGRIRKENHVVVSQKLHINHQMNSEAILHDLMNAVVLAESSHGQSPHQTNSVRGPTTCFFQPRAPYLLTSP